MTTPASTRPLFVWQSISFKNLVLFLLILLVAVLPLAVRYYQDSRDAEIRYLASKLEFFAERGASWIDATVLPGITQPEHMQTPTYRKLKRTLTRIEQEFDVDNAILMRRTANGQYTFIATGMGEQVDAPPSAPATRNPCTPTRAVANPCTPTRPAAAPKNPCTPADQEAGFVPGQLVQIHDWFPATYKATEDTWQAGEMMHSQLFGGETNGKQFDQFLQINTPLLVDGEVVAILMLNKFAKPVADAVRMNTIRVIGLTIGILVVGLMLFGYTSTRMLRPLKNLTSAASDVAQGNLDITLPARRSRDEVGRLSTTFDSMLEGLRQRDFIRDTFGRYLSKDIVEELLDSPDGLKMGGELRQVTILVSDLRGFTSLASNLPPQQVIEILNRYLERMVDIIEHYRGTVDEFQGDGILAFFGAPLAAPDDAERAVACAIAMQTALAEINAEQHRRHLPALQMGIGINTGEVIVGNIGSEKRTKYGAVGSAINEAYRIESYTVGGQVLVSPSVHASLHDKLQVQSMQDIHFKGLETAVTLYDITGLDGSYACTLPDKTSETLVSLSSPLPVTCFAVEGKTVSETAIAGTITRLSATAAAASLTDHIAPYSNVKVRLAPTNAAELPELYAKVLASPEDDAAGSGTHVLLEFTSLPQATETFLTAQRLAAVETVEGSAV